MNKLNKFKSRLNSSYWLKSGSVTFLTKVTESAFGLLIFLLLVRTLSKDDFGAWALLLTVAGILESLRKAFVASTLVRYVNIGKEEKYSKYVTGAIIQNALFTALTSLLLIVLAAYLGKVWESPGLEFGLYAYAFNNVVIGFFSICNYIQQANLNFHGTLYAFLLRKGLYFFFMVYIYFNPDGVLLWQIVGAESLIVILLIPVSILLTKPYFNNLSWSKEDFLSMINFGKFTIGISLTSRAVGNADSWILATLLSVRDVAFYNTAMRLLALVEIPIVSLTTISYPQLNRRIGANDISGATRIYEKSIGAIMAFIIPVSTFIIIFSDQIITLLAGASYLESSDLLKVTMIFAIFLPFNRQLGITLNALGHPKINLYFVLVNLIVNTASNIIFINIYGLMGAAYGTLFAYAASFIYGYFLINRYLSISLLSIFKYTFKYLANPLQIFKV